MQHPEHHLRLGIIGAAGRTGRQFVQAAKQARGLRLAGVADLAKDECRRVANGCGAKYFGSHRRILDSDDIDAVVVCVPPSRRPRLADEVIASGKPFLVPLPIAASIGEADALLRSLEAYQPAAGAASAYRHLTRAQVASRAIHGGQIGVVRSAVDVSTGHIEGSWSDRGGGILMGEAAHRLDLLVWLLGAPRQVSATCWPKTGSPAQVTTAVLDYGDGRHAVLHVRAPVWSEPHRFDAFGDKGRLTLDTAVHVATYGETPEAEPAAEPSRAGWVSSDDTTEGLATAMSHFAEAVRSARPPGLPLAEAALSLEVANALILAGHTGTTVPLPLDRQAYAKHLREMRKVERADAGG